MDQKWIKMASWLLLAAGTAVLVYPALSSRINEYLGSYAIQTFRQQLQQTDSDAVQRQRLDAQQYNSKLLHAPGEITEEEYWQLLDFQDGMMGYIRIPDIGADIPVYHGVSEEVLAKGVGHLPGSALPIGGEGNHSVLTGHTGLPSAELFTRLTELEEGDLFYIAVLDEVLTYRVDRIRVVLPEDRRELQPVAGEDLCTLVTCTPYGINTHRLLVRGRRETAPQLQEMPDAQVNTRVFPWYMVALPLVLTGGLYFTLGQIRRKMERS